ncbi:MAG: AbrB/MazE/SpoVT family DNA-binding domain-containing protein [Thermoplasmata archaeon]
MTPIVTIDKAGRIVIPEKTRAAQGLRAGTRFLLVEEPDGRLGLQRLDPEELARRIEKELEGVDLDPLIAKVRAELRRPRRKGRSGPRA